MSAVRLLRKQVGWGADAPFTGSSVTLPQNQDLHLSAHPARPLRISWHVLDQGAFLCGVAGDSFDRSEEHTSELQTHSDLVCRLLLEKKKNTSRTTRQLTPR